MIRVKTGGLGTYKNIMGGTMIYLDNAATTKISRRAREAMEPYLNEMYGNPSGVYNLATEAKDAIELARSNVAKAIHCRAENIFFTSGGSESDNWVLDNAKRFGNHIITSKIEHHAIIHKCEALEKEGMKISYADNDRNGMVLVHSIKNNIRKNTSLISVMFANNEIGTIEPVEQIGKIAQERQIPFHTDAVQAIGHVPIDVDRMNIDMMSASGHKFNGPKGSGFLYVREPKKIFPMIYGGGQEMKKRAGTENVANIVGMSVALTEAVENMEQRMKKEIKMRNYLVNRILNEIPYVKYNGHPLKRLPGNANFSFAGIDGASLVVLLDNENVCVSSGSACSTGSEEVSHVLKAIGVPDKLAYGTVRITLSSENTFEELNYTIEKLKDNIQQLRKSG